MAAEYVVLANEPGRHGFDVVGTFDSPDAGMAWLAEHGLSGSIQAKPLIAPDDWKPNDGRNDDVREAL